ncbi:hypothetical protein HID58_022178 [Brassica napus]|uniref:Uncharacterized protein n=1 Tax=Brassica napus TaxID=3708 RepID=A0ABQ8CYI4_BRANA|nr:hypothetical protein HID58_022178 [Brassica napus]
MDLKLHEYDHVHWFHHCGCICIPASYAEDKKDNILNARCIIMNAPVHNVQNIHNQWFSFRCYKQARSRRI